MKFLIIPLIALSLIFLTPSCSKYPNGSKFTLLTKANRMVNDWKLTSYMINGNEFVDDQPEIKLVIEKDGTYSWSSTQTVLGQIQSEFEHGTWSFNDDKTSLLILTDGEEIPVGYTITELRSKKMVLQYYDKVTNITYVSTYETDK
ncbi:MAG: hypothetical protein RL365_1069 [Bacteroidota bacterium]|jgi:hypothetical protein